MCGLTADQRTWPATSFQTSATTAQSAPVAQTNSFTNPQS